jgi:hypothetical protein
VKGNNKYYEIAFSASILMMNSITVSKRRVNAVAGTGDITKDR